MDLMNTATTPDADLADPAGRPRVTVLPPEVWRPTQEWHAGRVDELTSGHRARARAGTAHPVEDFLFSYYSLRPAQLRRWYPGPGIALAGAPERAGWKFHRVLPAPSQPSTVALDVPGFVAARSAQLSFTGRLLAATASRPGQFGCFGLHEWAMVYRQGPLRRHQQWPLRLGQQGTDEVVRGHQVKCTHFDAFRFFTPPARSLNLTPLDRDSQTAMEQPGCLHAAMDVYKWAYKLSPAVPSDLLLDTFVLAAKIRELDMRASPYDLADLGYPPVRIETPDGKAEYVAAQRDFASSAAVLRARLLAVIIQIAPGAAAQPEPASVAGLAPLSDRHPVPGSNLPGTTRRRS
jgi:hypothetical protein